MVGEWFDCDTDYAPAQVWQDTQHEYGGVFFSNRYAGRSDLFEGLSIWEEAFPYRQLQGTFPVIFLSFAYIKADEYEKMEYMITDVIASVYAQNSYLLEGDCLSENEKTYYRSIRPGIRAEVAAGAIHSMAGFMKRYHNKEVIIILDEYDTPMQESWLSGYWDKAAIFLAASLIAPSRPIHIFIKD